MRCLLDVIICFCQAEDGIRDLVRSRGLGDVYKRQPGHHGRPDAQSRQTRRPGNAVHGLLCGGKLHCWSCLLYTSDAADERSSVDLGGRRIIKKKKTAEADAGRTRSDMTGSCVTNQQSLRDTS